MSPQALARHCKRNALAGVIATALTLPGSGIAAPTIGLFEWGLNLDGVVLSGGPLPGNINASTFDFGTGLGTLVVTVSTVGAHQVTGFFDHEIDERANTFFNEFGTAFGAPAAGQLWEIDEPGFVFGDIYDNFLAGTLDQSNGVPVGAPDDVSMALGSSFILAADEAATLRFVIGAQAPASGFYLQQSDPDSNASIYFSSSLVIGGQEPSIPEPTSLALLGLGLVALWGARRSKAGA